MEPQHRAIWCRVGDISIKEYPLPISSRQSVPSRCAVTPTDVSDVTAKMRVVHGSRTLEVEGLAQSDWGDRSTLMRWEITP